jgi:hypothetical protein
VLLGPVTLLLLSQAPAGSPAGFAPLDRLSDVLDGYARLLASLAAEGVDRVQLDEPALVADRSPAELAALARAYGHLGGLTDRPRLFVATYFGDPGDALAILTGAPIEAIGLDLVRAPGTVRRIGDLRARRHGAVLRRAPRWLRHHAARLGLGQPGLWTVNPYLSGGRGGPWRTWWRQPVGCGAAPRPTSAESHSRCTPGLW